MKIYKYPLNLAAEQTLQLPKGARILTFQTQYTDVATIWAMVDPDAEMEDRHLYIVGTGHDVPEGLTYIGTAQMGFGHYVWHLFEDRLRFLGLTT